MYLSLSKDFGKRYKILSRPISLKVKDNSNIILSKALKDRICYSLVACHNKERRMKRMIKAGNIWQEMGSGSSNDFITKGKYQNLLKPVPHFLQIWARKEQDKRWCWRWQGNGKGVKGMKMGRWDRGRDGRGVGRGELIIKTFCFYQIILYC